MLWRLRLHNELSHLPSTLSDGRRSVLVVWRSLTMNSSIDAWVSTCWIHVHSKYFVLWRPLIFVRQQIILTCHTTAINHWQHRDQKCIVTIQNDQIASASWGFVSKTTDPIHRGCVPLDSYRAKLDTLNPGFHKLITWLLPLPRFVFF